MLWFLVTKKWEIATNLENKYITTLGILRAITSFIIVPHAYTLDVKHENGKKDGTLDEIHI